MENIHRISLASVTFSLNELAFNKLDTYLKKLKIYYSNDSDEQQNSVENVNEILSDIEIRIAELLQEINLKDRLVISEDIDVIIQTLGEPYGQTINTSTYHEKLRKRLFRNLRNRVLGGVCGGIAAYSGLDVVLVRIIFVLLVLGVGWFNASRYGFYTFLFIYVVPWIIIPAARTIAQHYVMYGKSPKLGEDLNGAGYFDLDERRYDSDSSSFLRKLFGVILLIISSILLVSIFSWSVFLLVFTNVFYDFPLFTIFEEGKFELVLGLFFILIALPDVWLFYAGLRLVSSRYSSRSRFSLIVLILWIISLITFVCLTKNKLNDKTIQDMIDYDGGAYYEYSPEVDSSSYDVATEYELDECEALE